MRPVTLLVLVLVLASCVSDPGAEVARTPATAPSRSGAEPPERLGSPADRISGRAERAARAYVAFARGSDVSVPWGDRVRYRLNGRVVARLSSVEAGESDRWEACLTEGSSVEGRECPVSVLSTIAGEATGQPLPLQAAAPRTVGCNRARPSTIDGVEEAVTIRQRRARRNCFDDFAATLLLDREGRILAVDFVLSGP